MIKSIQIKDSINEADKTAIEVEIELENGSKRWCFFITPEGIRNFGDTINGLEVRVHFGAKHMIVVSDISEEIIHKFLIQVDKNNELIYCTEPFQAGKNT